MPDTLNVFHLLAVAVFVVGVACDVFLAQRFGRAPLLRVGAKPWGLRELIVASAIVVGVILAANVVYFVIAHATGRDFDALAPLMMPVELVLRLGLLAGFWMFFRYQRIAIAPAFGLEAGTHRRAIGWGVIFGFASVPPVALILFISELVCRSVGIPTTDQPVAELFRVTDSRSLLLTLTLFGVIVAPVFEEFFFRGFAYPALKQRLGPARAMLLVSAVFALTHFHAPSVVPLFALSIGLGLAFELTGSLLVPVTMHAVFNGLMIARLFYERLSA